MNQIKIVFSIALIQAVVLVFGSLDGAMGQAYQVVSPLDQPSHRISSRLMIQDPIQLETPKPDEPDSFSELKQQEDDAREEAKRESLEQERMAAEERRLEEKLRQQQLDDEMEMEDENLRQPQRPEFGPWPRKGIRGISVDIREQSMSSPPDRSAQLLNSGGSQWSSFSPAPKVFAWAAPNIRYQPLYFEDVPLERYGQTAAPYAQSAISGARMFKSFVLLPHQMRHDASGSCDSPLGFCRPGNKVPYTIQRTYHGNLGR